MKKLFMFLCIWIMFFGIVGCPSSDDPASTSFTSTPVATAPSAGGSSGTSPSPVPEPVTLLLIGSGLVGLGVLGRKRFKR